MILKLKLNILYCVIEIEIMEVIIHNDRWSDSVMGE